MVKDGAVELGMEHLGAGVPSHTSHGARAVELDLHLQRSSSGYSFQSQRRHKTHECTHPPENRWPCLVSFAESTERFYQ